MSKKDAENDNAAQQDSSSVEPVAQEPKSQVREWSEALIVALVLALIIRAFILQAYRIPSSSMEDTLLKGDHILATKYNYGVTVPFTTHKILGRDIVPDRGDVIIFSYPLDPKTDFVKRCIGLPGDKIMVKNKHVYINGKEYAGGYEKHTDPYAVSEGKGRVRDNMEELTIPPAHVFAMGDNRDQSYDSRFWGPLPIENIKGKAWLIYFSWDPDHFMERLKRIGSIIR